MLQTWNFKIYLSSYTFSNNGKVPNVSQTVSPTCDQVFYPH